MIIKNVNLETVCGITSAIPDNLLDEVAFAGKSNVGKSSLINALMNRKSLARTSSQPGKTQTINFYNVNEAMYLVDLPGYGYANANIEIKAKWGQMIENYLHTSKRLKAVFLLIDIRHEPSENDQMMYEWMVHQGFAPIIIATKSDKLKKMQILQHVQMIKDILQVEPGTIVIPFSAESKQGREEIWQIVESVIELPQGYIEAENAKREAKAVLEQSEAYRQAVQTQLVATIANSYYTLLMLDEQLEISRRTAENWSENLRVMKALKKAGQTTDMAVAQTEASKLSVDASLLSIERQITETENALCALLGSTPETISRSTLKQQKFPDTLSVGIPLQLLHRRPDVRQSEAALAAAFYVTNQAHSAFYPSITLSGSAGWTNAAGTKQIPF